MRVVDYLLLRELRKLGPAQEEAARAHPPAERLQSHAVLQHVGLVELVLVLQIRLDLFERAQLHALVHVELPQAVLVLHRVVVELRQALLVLVAILLLVELEAG